MRPLRYMWMETPQHALDIIADMVDMQSPLSEQDAWLKAAIALGFVEIQVPYDDANPNSIKTDEEKGND